MKKIFNSYVDIIFYTICGVLVILSSYLILVNINHYVFIDKEVLVSSSDSDLEKLKENINKLEEIDNENIKSVIMHLKKDGAYKLLPGDKLSYIDLYNLNLYFLDTVINECWVRKLALLDEYNTNYNNEFIDNLIINAKHLDKELLNNSNYHYNYNNNTIDEINEEYHLILNNYNKFSVFLLEISG